MNKIFRRLFVPVLYFICFASGLEAQTIRYVKQGGTGNGSSWTNASGDFQAAINASAVNDEVWVAAGDYQTNAGTPYNMKEGVKIYGGFPNTGNPDMSSRNWTSSVSRLIGRQLIENGPPSCRVISNLSNGLTAAAVLDGFTLYNGYALDHGGGMRNQNVSPTIRNCIFTGNNAVGNGGGMHNTSSHPVIINCIFSNNLCGLSTSYGNGAGIFNDASNPIITNCEFNNNKIQRSNLTNGGGAMYNSFSSPIITNGKFSGNDAYVGGAVFNYTSSPQFINSRFSGNTSAYRGGGVYNSSTSEPIFRYCIFSGNSSVQGGGIANTEYSKMSLINCLLYGNNGQFGGALYNEIAFIDLLNTTIANNTATSSGGAIESSEFIPPNAPANLNIRNTIISGNSSGVNLYKNTGKVINSLVQSITPNASNVIFTYTNNTDGTLDPKFLNPSDPDGADNIFGTADDGYSLQATSPVINLGSNAEVPADLTKDMAGAARIQGSVVDIGAYESSNNFNCGSSTLYVDGTRSSSGEGISWTTAFKTLGEALNRAGSCNNVNTILVAKGTYYPTGQQNGTDRNEAFVIPQRGGIKIYGGYPNGGGNRDLLLNSTILSGDIGTSGNSSDNSYHIIVVTGTSAAADSVVIDGFTVTKANANGGQYYYNSVQTYQNEGGGILLRQNNNFSKLALRNCNVIGNSAASYGAGIYCGGTSALISNCVSADNTGVQNGGGLFAHASNDIRISGSVLSGNSAVNGSAIFTLDATLKVVNCTVAGNASGINNSGSSNTTITGSVFWNNSADNIQNSATLNISYSNVQQASGVYTGTGNINTDPLFVNAASPAGADGIWRTADDGFKLQAGSPAINAGSPDITGLPLGTVDLSGQTRVFGGRVDMGAYESSYSACSEIINGVLYVDASVAQSGNGAGWSTAFKTLYDALSTVNGCSNINTILVAQGTYYTTNTTNRDAGFVIPARGNLKIYGGYPSGGGTRNITNYPTILSGDVGVIGNNSDNSYHVMVIANINAAADSIVVDGISFTGGNANGSGNVSINGYSLSRNTGGGLLIAIDNGNTKIAIRNCRSFNNQANQGAGIFNLAASPTIVNTVLQGNTSADNGGGMSNYTNANPTLINMLITGNRAGFAGGVFNDNSSPVFINSTIADNYAGEAGGTFNRGNAVNVIFRNSIIYGNRNASGVPSNIFNNSNGTASFSYSLVETATAAWESALGTDNGNNLFIDPKFVSRNEPTSGNTPNTSGNYSLINSSPVIDAGNNALLSAGISTDIAGAVRIQQAAVDMGAYESPYYNCSVFAFTVTATNIKCFGSKGSATVTVNKGVAPFTYSWSNGAGTATVNDLVAGNYSCTVTDANGCTTTKNITITGPATALVATTDQNNIKCYGAGNGTASVNASGGISPYTYSWSNGSTASAITGLATGTYTCTITDAAGCVVTKTVVITQPAAALSATTTQTNVSCYNGNTGVATVVVAGGTEPYTYAWSDGATTASISGLTVGNYTCTITDAANCTLVKNFTITQPAAALTATATHTNVKCFNGNNGTASLTVNGGTAPYTYSWSNGSTTAVLNNVTAGDYHCTVTDAKGCVVTVDVTITQPASPINVIKNKKDVVCYNAHTGEASVTASDGVAPYTYLWSGGATTSAVSGLAAGTYSCTISDATGCSVVSSFIIDQPASAIAVAASQTNVLCYGGNSGTAKVVVSGGVAPYTYSWSSGVTTPSISDLAAGNYTCTITDAGGCSKTQSFTITQPAAALAATGSHTDITCYNGNNGKASVSVSGGTTPYTYNWSNGATSASLNNLTAGNYTCTVTDANGCVVQTNVSVEQPATALTVNKSQTDIGCYGASTGSAILSVSGGVAPYSYSWNNGSTGSRIDNINAGSYSCTVTDSRGCAVVVGFVITQPAASLTYTFSQTDVLCKNGNTGSATINVSGGVAPYHYQWTTTATGATATGLSAGNYSVLVTDANGCTISKNFTITEPTQLSAQVISTTSDFCNSGKAGTAMVQGAGGVLPYTYLWSNGSNNAIATGFGAGNYNVVITDANGCTANAVVTVANQAFAGNTIYVDSSIAVPGDGTSWSKAVRELSDAMNIATSCNGVNNIMVAKGTYKPVGRSGSNNRDSAFLVRQNGGLKMYGGYPSGGGVRNVTANATVLSGELGADWNIADNAYHIMVIAGLGSTADSVVVDGFTFYASFTWFMGTYWYNGIEVGNNGGAICLYNNNDAGGKVAIRNCNFNENYSMNNGGAIYNQASSPSILNCTFTANYASELGGAIMNENASSPLISDCKFFNNEGDLGGGAICNLERSNAIIRSSRFTENFCTTWKGGGAIANENSAPSIVSCYLAGNYTRNYLPGGAIYNNNASLKIVNTIIAGNKAERSNGGGIANFNNSSVTLISCTVYGNLSIRGSVHNDGSQMKVINTILRGSSWELWNTNGGTATVNYSIVQGWTGGGTGNPDGDTDPVFVNGDAYNYINGDYRLRACSPVINVGTTDTSGLNLPLLEMSGLPRVQLGRIDIGAMEANSYANETASVLPATASSTAAYQLKNGTTWYAVDCQTLIAAVTGSGSNPVSGNTNASVDMDVTLLPGTVSRVYEVTPDNDAATASGTITLYFTQAEFAAYNTANTGNNKLPLPDKDDPQMNDKFSNIRIRKVSGGTTTIITPQLVKWNAGLQRWEITFDVTGFSKFYVFTQNNTSLPLRLISFAVKEENCKANISWTTAEEVAVSHFDVEYSADGTSWIFSSQTKAENAAGERKYNTLANINAAVNYYRLKMVDIDGRTTYSKVVKLISPLNCIGQAIKLYPNPAVDVVYIEKGNPGDTYSFYDNTGRLVLQGTIKKDIQDIDLRKLLPGVYAVFVMNKKGATQTVKIIKTGPM